MERALGGNGHKRTKEEREVLFVCCTRVKRRTLRTPQHDNEQEMLLCDGCDKEFHMFCLCPVLVTLPLGDWFCPLCSPAALVCEFPKVQKKINDFFRILKPFQISPGNAPFTHTWHDVGYKKNCYFFTWKVESEGFSYAQDLLYFCFQSLAHRMANNAKLEKGGMQVMGKEDKGTMEACKAMCSHGEWPPLMVTHDSRHRWSNFQREMTQVRTLLKSLLYVQTSAATLPDLSLALTITHHLKCRLQFTDIEKKADDDDAREGKKKQNLHWVQYDVDGEPQVFLIAIRDIHQEEHLY
ncbi:unnamed protein product [Sphagnum troendelagicum]|uniref:PHD-type domain-containing protein n=1 Tax=Sphagnum troendelagicum TaxID=128251 RepID=A0ABP0TDL5_9BRYO